MISAKRIFLFLGVVLLASFFLYRDINSPYLRSINSDGKGYYAYLPALFIYQDQQFSFIHEVEKKYYPKDGSHFKDFLNPQPNGTKVNKTFPGLSLLYAPFFFLGCFFAWIFGYAVDGYSIPFQLMIGLSHIVYLLLGLRFLWDLLQKLGLSVKTRVFSVLVLVFGTNIWFYTIYDHTVGHVFSFFLCALFLWLVWGWLNSRKFLGWILIVLALIVIIRPTNAIMVLFIPFLASLMNVEFRSVFPSFSDFKSSWVGILVSSMVVALPLFIWKWQTGNWLVYSYKDEGFDFSSPHWIDFMFSVQKGWLFWTPIMFIVLVMGARFSFLKSRTTGILFLLPIVLMTYVLSSWWCWTFGAGMGQRVMIEFYPYLILPFAYGIDQKWNKMWIGVALFFIPLNLLQAYQVVESIHIGGQSTMKSYRENFFRLTQPPPSVEIEKTWKKLEHKDLKIQKTLSKTRTFSTALEFKLHQEADVVVLTFSCKAEEKLKESRIVVSSEDGLYYKAFFLKDIVRKEPELFSYLIDDLPKGRGGFKIYFWNGDTNENVYCENIKVDQYEAQ